MPSVYTRQNGHVNPRENQTTTLRRPRYEARSTTAPRRDGSENAGAIWPTAGRVWPGAEVIRGPFEARPVPRAARPVPPRVWRAPGLSGWQDARFLSGPAG